MKVNIVVPEPVPPPPTVVHVQMPLEVAATLYAIFGSVGGSPDASRRGHTTAIYNAIERAVSELDSENRVQFHKEVRNAGQFFSVKDGFIFFYNETDTTNQRGC